MVSINALSRAEFQKLTQLKAEKKRTKKHILLIHDFLVASVDVEDKNVTDFSYSTIRFVPAFFFVVNSAVFIFLSTR